MEFNKQNLAALNDEIKAALEAVAAKHGLTVKVGGGRYSEDGMFRPRVEFSGEARGENEWNTLCAAFGFKPEHYGAVVSYGGRDVKLVGLNTKARSYPVTIEEVHSGKRFKCPRGDLPTRADEVLARTAPAKHGRK